MPESQCYNDPMRSTIDLSLAASLYGSGASLREVARACGCSHMCVSRALARHGVPKRRRGRPHAYVVEIRASRVAAFWSRRFGADLSPKSAPADPPDRAASAPIFSQKAAPPPEAQPAFEGRTRVEKILGSLWQVCLVTGQRRAI